MSESEKQVYCFKLVNCEEVIAEVLSVSGEQLDPEDKNSFVVSSYEIKNPKILVRGPGGLELRPWLYFNHNLTTNLMANILLLEPYKTNENTIREYFKENTGNISVPKLNIN